VIGRRQHKSNFAFCMIHDLRFKRPPSEPDRQCLEFYYTNP
jgi:hypothetical protein